jgi:hypothetical protein
VTRDNRDKVTAQVQAYDAWTRNVRAEWAKALRAGKAQPDDDILIRLIDTMPEPPPKGA